MIDDDFDEVKCLMEIFKKRELTEEEHNKMIALAVEHPKRAAIQVYFEIIKKDPTGVLWRNELKKYPLYENFHK